MGGNDMYDDDDKPKDSGCRKCGKAIIIIANILFFIIGAAIMTVGILLLTNTNIWGDSITTATDSVTGIVSQANLVGYSNSTSGTAVDLSAITFDLGIALTAVGGLILLMGIFGLSILCCDDIISTVLYVIIFSLLIIAQIAVLIVISIGALNGLLNDKLVSSIQNEFIGIDDFTSISLTTNFVHFQFKCCGINDYTDFNNATNWNKTRTFTVSGTEQSITLTTPLSCCKLDNDLTSATGFLYDSSPSCAQSALNSTISNYDQGCWAKISDAIVGYKTMLIAIPAVAIVLQVALLVVTLVLFLCKSRQDDEDEPEEMTKPDPRKQRGNFNNAIKPGPKKMF